MANDRMQPPMADEPHIDHDIFDASSSVSILTDRIDFSFVQLETLTQFGEHVNVVDIPHVLRRKFFDDRLNLFIGEDPALCLRDLEDVFGETGRGGTS